MDAAKRWLAGLMAKEVSVSERVAVCACAAAPHSAAWVCTSLPPVLARCLLNTDRPLRA